MKVKANNTKTKFFDMNSFFDNETIIYGEGSFSFDLKNNHFDINRHEVEIRSIDLPLNDQKDYDELDDRYYELKMWGMHRDEIKVSINNLMETNREIDVVYDEKGEIPSSIQFRSTCILFNTKENSKLEGTALIYFVIDDEEALNIIQSFDAKESFKNKKTSKRKLMETLIALKKVKQQKRDILEHYTKKALNERHECCMGVACKHPKMDQEMFDAYAEDCNDYLAQCQDVFSGCLDVPEIAGCFDGICDPDGVIYDDCPEDDFDDCIDTCIDMLALLVVPVRVCSC